MKQTQTSTNGKNSQHKRTFIIWLAIFPLITLLVYLLEDYLALLPLVARTFLLTIMAVPLMAYCLLPLYNRLFRKWLD
jgi:antibiotic biosynthesis monooxygenase (ABM) superfamily enzyme